MTTAPLFGVLLLDRDPLVLANLAGLLQAWLQDAGGFAFAGLTLYLLYVLRGSQQAAAAASAEARRRQSASEQTRTPVTGFMILMYAAGLLAYAGFLALWASGVGKDTLNVTPYLAPGETAKYVPPRFSFEAQPLLLMAAGLFALLGVGQPFARDLLKCRGGRIWALTKVGYKEAKSNRVFLVFLLILLPFLFPATWFGHNKPEDELRVTIATTDFGTTFLLLVPALILAAFSIPNDIKYQTIYTIVSKPVERFEYVLGRFLGYVGLMTVALAAITLVSVLLIAFGTNLDPAAVKETYLARVPVRGTMEFKSRKDDFVGTNVGREFEYRKYIAGHPATSERAVWSFDRVPAALADAGRKVVPCEVTFDIFRLTKGDENKGVFVNVRVCSHQCEQTPPAVPRDGTWRWKNADKERQYEADKRKLEDEFKESIAFVKPADEAKWAKVNELAKKYGFYEAVNVEVYDYHPTTIAVPPGVFENARDGDPQGKPRVQVFVKCESPGQMLGTAQGDLYLLEGQQPFALNYFKTAFGLWCRLTLVIGVAVTLSTYLTGIISLLATAFLYISAYFAEHLADVARGGSVGGGPFESLTRLIRTDSPTTQLDATATVRTATTFDAVYAWVFRRFQNLVPDVDAFTWTHFLKEGFNVNVEYLVVNLFVLAAYLLPWGILSYYLMRNREVAA